ncbi:MAG TPA: hypothetical protein H9759_08305 [Candidatus Dietzia intestinipullorum]|nr:hypothetical protein [Candidatus Dietzia intestinipullorum]
MSSQEADGGGDRAEGGASVPRWLAVVSVVVLVAGLVILGVFGWRYLEARESHSVATERDAVTDVASQVIINAFSFDHRDVDESLEHLASVSTGDFRAEQDQWAEDVRTRVVEQKAVTTATVSHTAVTTLDTDADEAAVLVVFTAHSEREGEDDITGRQAMRVDLVREDGQWKASAVDQVGVTVPVGESSESVQGLGGSVMPGDDATEEGATEEGADSADEDATDQTESEESTPAPTTSGGR